MDIQCISCTFILRRSCIIATINYCISAKDRLFSTSGCYCDNIIYRSSIAASTTSNNLTVYLTATDSYFIAICRLTCTISTIDLTVISPPLIITLLPFALPSAVCPPLTPLFIVPPLIVTEFSIASPDQL